MSSPRPLGGVGVGLRWELLDDVLAFIDRTLDDEALARAVGAVPFWEVSPENYMRRGGYFVDALGRVADRFPLAVHGLTLGIGGTDPFEPGFLRELRGFLGRVDPPYFSEHLCATGMAGRVLHDLLPIPLTQGAAHNAARRAAEVQDRLARPLLLENVTHYMVPGLATVPEAALITEVVTRADVGLLLDVNNVHVNAKNYGFDPYAFLRALPLERVAEIHVAGPERSAEDDLWIDSHGADVPAPVLDLLEWVIERVGSVPVLLERDNKVPALADLLAERDRVEAVYRRGLARFEARVDDTGVLSTSSLPLGLGPAAAEAGLGEQARLAALLRLVHELVRDRAAPAALTADARAWLSGLGLSAPDVDALAGLPPHRLLLYRRLVRRGLTRAIRLEVPRVAARLGPAFERWAERYFDEELPRSHYLRDVAFEMVDWALPRWAADPDVPAHLRDLARHELAEFETAAQPADPPDAPRAPLDLGRPVLLHATARVLRLEHAVHRLAEDDTTTSPAAEPTALLLYRDAQHDVRTLELTPLAAELLERLLAGRTLRDALAGACEATGSALDAAVLDGTSTLLADLAERGVLHGAAVD